MPPNDYELVLGGTCPEPAFPLISHEDQIYYYAMDIDPDNGNFALAGTIHTTLWYVNHYYDAYVAMLDDNGRYLFLKLLGKPSSSFTF